MINTPLFMGKLIRLIPIDPERDAEEIAGWTNDPHYQWQMEDAPACPMSVAQVKRQLEEMAKEAETSRNSFNFSIRTLDGDQLVGTARLFGAQWTNGASQLAIGLGESGSWEKGYAADALERLLHYAFAELNLYRLEVKIDETNAQVIHLLEQAGFNVEVRRRQAIFRAGKRWDLLHFGLLCEDWRQRMGQRMGNE